MGLSSAVQWWQEWQLRILVLGSLFIQFFIFYSIYLRKVPALRRLRVLVWIAYIGGDALAVYALATLFNRHKQTAGEGSSSALEVVWAPVLLIHLGGNTNMSAYSLEDNELWRRHAITLVSQVTVALYVFCKWWSGEKRLLQATVLLFVVGILKFSQKPWALKKASFKGMLASAAESTPRREEGCIPPCIATCWRWCTSSFVDRAEDKQKRRLRGGREGSALSLKEAEGKKEEERAPSLKKYVEIAREKVAAREKDEAWKKVAEEKAVVEARNPCGEFLSQAGYMRKLGQMGYLSRIFVDLSPPYSRRLSDLQMFLESNDKDAYNLLQTCMGNAFELLYTRLRAGASILSCCLLLSLPFLALASVVLFAKSHKDGYDDKDVKVTYILLCCTAVLEICPCLPEFPCYLFRACRRPWHDMVSQHSIMSFYVRKTKPTVLMKLAALVCLREYVNKHWYVGQEPAAYQITALVRGHVKDGWKTYIRDAASYRRFNNLRGQWTLRKYSLGWSLKDVPFDESVLLWHIATDLCFHHPNTSPQGQAAAQRGREISNYMAYLLFIHPEMLMLGARPGLFTNAGDDIGVVLKHDNEPQPPDEKSVSLRILYVAQRFPSLYFVRIGDLVPKACRIAEALMELRDEKTRWEVIQGVWVEMLCYSAPRCTGYLHAKSLGEGGEYLSYVWLLLSFMGMETLADKIQNPEPPEEEEEEEEAEEEEEDRAAATAGSASGSRAQGSVVDQTAEISSSPA